MKSTHSPLITLIQPKNQQMIPPPLPTHTHSKKGGNSTMSEIGHIKYVNKNKFLLTLTSFSSLPKDPKPKFIPYTHVFYFRFQTSAALKT
ncbi:hypothetical protein Hanom_Chr08g00705831 [Helianthus anomalus]